MAYTSQKHGRAEYGSYMQVPLSTLSGINEGSDNEPLSGQKFAQMVYSVNPSQISLSGASISVSDVGLNDSGDVKLSGDQLKVHDEEAIEAINNISTNYSQLIRVNGNFTYVMKSSIGAGTSGDAIWQIKRIEKDGDNNDILWADGDDKFDNIASNYISLTYSL